jgi:hypothetical protein
VVAVLSDRHGDAMNLLKPTPTPALTTPHVTPIHLQHLTPWNLRALRVEYVRANVSPAEIDVEIERQRVLSAEGPARLAACVEGVVRRVGR